MTCPGGCVHRHIMRWLFISVCAGTRACAHIVKEKWLQMENAQMGVSALKNLFGDAVAYLYVPLHSWRVNFHSWICQHKHKPISEGLCWDSDHVCTLSFHTSCSYHPCFLGKTLALEKVHVLYSLFLKAILSTLISALQSWLKQSSFAGNWRSDFFNSLFRLFFFFSGAFHLLEFLNLELSLWTQSSIPLKYCP